jgi:hypothetical protein
MSELATIEPQNQMAVVTPMTLIERAATRGASLDELEKWFAFKKQVEADEAEKAFVQAMADFKAEQIQVTKDKENKQYGSRYTSISNLVNTVTPYLSKHGLSADWDMDQSDGIRITCILTHCLGHSKRVSMKVPPDTSGAKNPLQQIKSATTYAKIATFEMVCGLASTDGNLDDDGNGSGGARLDEKVVIDCIEAIRSASTDSELKQRFFEAKVQADSAKDNAALTDFIKAKDQRYRQLHPRNGGAN